MGQTCEKADHSVRLTEKGDKMLEIDLFFVIYSFRERMADLAKDQVALTLWFVHPPSSVPSPLPAAVSNSPVPQEKEKKKRKNDKKDEDEIKLLDPPSPVSRSE